MKLHPFVCLLACTVSLTAADWPQYRGPTGDGISQDRIALKWPVELKSVWKVPCGAGFSSFALAAGKCVALEGRDQKEVLVARDAANGKELWTAEVGQAQYDGGGNDGVKENNGGDGPRSTPTIAGNVVVASTADMVVSGYDLSTGKPLWKHDLIAEFAGKNIAWKNAASPLLEGGLIYLAGGGPGQTFMVLDPTSGAIVTKTGDDTLTHATPVAATILGQRQVIFFMKSGLTSFEPKTLKQLWHADFPFNVSSAASPVVAGDLVYCSAGYNVGAGVFKITKEGLDWKATQVMRTPGDKPLANHWSTPVFKSGHLYGMFQFKKYGNGPVKCVALPGGEVKWEKEGFGPGHVVLLGDNLLALSDAGELVLIAAKPDAYTELARGKVLDGKCWTTPAVSNGRVYVRSTKEAACYDLSK